MKINNLVDLNRYRSAPLLELNQIEKLLGEIEKKLSECDWITVGVMARSDFDAINALYSLTERYSFIKLKAFGDLRAQGCVFLKANQKNGMVYIRSENGLGEGILITCQYDDSVKESLTFGPFPLDIFK